MAQQPTHRVSITRKDGKDITYTDHRGSTVTKKYCPVGALFPSRVEGGYSFVLERKVTLDPDLVWVNVYTNKPRETVADETPETPVPAKRGRRTKAAASPPPAEAPLFDDDELPD